MASNTEIGIRLSLTGEQQVRQALGSVESQMERMTSAMARVGHYGTAFLAMQQAIMPTAGAALRAADAVTTLNNQLKLATGSTQAAASAYESLFSIAQRSRVSFTELGSTFASISRAGQELGLSQQRLLGVTEAIGNAMTVGGGSAASMNAALVQLGQGLSSGTLRGEELNSVMEQTPRLAKAIADGLGVPIGKLREMGAAGELSAQQVISALEKQASVLKGEVAGATLTVGQAMTVLTNATTKMVGDMSTVTGAASGLSSAIVGLSEHLGLVAGAAGAVGSVFAGKLVAGMAQSVAVATQERAALVASLQARVAQTEAVAIYTGMVVKATQADLAHMVGATGVRVKQDELVAARARHTAAIAAQTAAQNGLNAATSIGARAMGLLGGPVGLVTTLLGVGVSAWMAWKASAVSSEKSVESQVVDSDQEIRTRIDAQIAKLRERNRLATEGVPELQSALGRTAADAGAIYASAYGRHQAVMNGTGQFANLTDASRAALILQSGQAMAKAYKDYIELSEGAAQEATDKTRASFDKFLKGYRSAGDKVKDALDAYAKEFKPKVALGEISQSEYDAGLKAIAASAPEAAKAIKETGNAFASEQDAAELWAKAMASGAEKLADLQIESQGLVGAQAELAKLMASDAWSKWSPEMQAMVKSLYDQVTETDKLVTSTHALAKAEDERIKSLEGNAGTAAQRLQQMRDEETAAMLAEAQNISLAQAIEQVAIARLSEQQAALMREGNRDAEVLAIQSEIDARRKLVDAIGLKDARDAAKKGAEATATEWKRASDQIEQSLTDALMRGFESGEDAAKVLRDTVVNMFKTMVLRPVVQGVVQIGLDAVGLGGLGGSGGGGALGMANNAYGAWNAGNSMWVSNFSGAASTQALQWGDWLATSQNDFAAGVGELMQTNYAEIGSAANALGTAAAALQGLNSLAEGNYGGAAGSAIGYYFGGPIVAAIGNAIGGSLNEALFGNAGTHHTGGVGSYSAAQGALTGSAADQWVNFDPNKRASAWNGDANTASATIAQMTATALDGFAQSFGQQAGYLVGTGFQDDSSSDGAWGALKIALGDQVLLDWGRGNDRWPGREFANGQAGQEGYMAALATDVRTVLMDISPDWADSVLQALGDSPTLADLAQAVQSIAQANAALTNMKSVMPQLAGATEDATDALIAMFGGGLAGVENLGTALGSYYQNFYTEAERTANTTAQVAEALGALGLAMPSTRDGFRSLVEAQDLTTEAGRATYAALLQLSPAFASVTEAAVSSAQALQQAAVASLQSSFSAFSSLAQTSAGYGNDSGLTDYLGLLQGSYDYANGLDGKLAVLESIASAESAASDTRLAALQDELSSVQVLADAAKGLRGFVDGLRTGSASPLSNAEMYQMLGAKFSMQLSLARAGDTESFNALQGTASAYLDVAKSQSATAADYALAFAKVTGELDALGSTTESTATQQAALLQKQVDALDALGGVSAKTQQLTYDLLGQARAQFTQDLSLATDQLIATDGIASALAALPPELAAILSSSLASSIEPMLTNLANSVSSSMSAAGISALANKAATGQMSIADAQNAITYDALVQSAYAGIGRTGFGDALSQIDQAGYDYWVGVLETGASTVEAFQRNFQAAVDEYITNNPDDPYTQYVQSLPKFAVGTNYVPQDMVAMIHEGEAIVPKAYNPAAMSGMGGKDTERLEALVEGLTAEVQRLQAVVREGNLETRRAADAVNGRPEQPMPVETV